jgi:hypothetical protein
MTAGPRRAGRGAKALLAKEHLHSTTCDSAFADGAVPSRVLPWRSLAPESPSHGEGFGPAQASCVTTCPSRSIQLSRRQPRTRSRGRHLQPRPSANLMLRPSRRRAGPRRMRMAAARTGTASCCALPCAVLCRRRLFFASPAAQPHARGATRCAPGCRSTFLRKAPRALRLKGCNFSRRTAKRARPERGVCLRHTALSDGGPPGARGTVRMRGAERGRGPGDHQPLQGSARCRSRARLARARARATLGSAGCWPAASAAGRRQHSSAHVREAYDRALAPRVACGQSPGTTHRDLRDLLLLSHSATPSAPISRQAATLAPAVLRRALGTGAGTAAVCARRRAAFSLSLLPLPPLPLRRPPLCPCSSPAACAPRRRLPPSGRCSTPLVVCLSHAAAHRTAQAAAVASTCGSAEAARSSAALRPQHAGLRAPRRCEALSCCVVLPRQLRSIRVQRADAGQRRRRAEASSGAGPSRCCPAMCCRSPGLLRPQAPCVASALLLCAFRAGRYRRRGGGGPTGRGRRRSKRQQQQLSARARARGRLQRDGCAGHFDALCRRGRHLSRTGAALAAAQRRSWLPAVLGRPAKTQRVPLRRKGRRTMPCGRGASPAACVCLECRASSSAAC